MPIQPTCLLCNVGDETRGHLFFNCTYFRVILLPLVESLTDIFWKVLNIPKPSTNNLDIKLRDLTQACQKLTHHCPIWGLLWNAIGTLCCYIGLAELSWKIHSRRRYAPEIQRFFFLATQ